jgi:hypothetical protein
LANRFVGAFVNRPGALETTLGTSGSVGVLNSKKSKNVFPVKGDLNRMIPQVPLVRPLAGDTRYFCYHKCLDLEIGSSMIQNSCGGKLCDRQSVVTGSTGISQGCGCLYKKDKCMQVTEHVIKFPVSMEFSQNGHVTVNDFRSRRFDELFMADNCLSAMNSSNLFHFQVLREYVKKVVQFINMNGGWTIIGWLRTGSVADASDGVNASKDVENIASLEVIPHVIFLYPTKLHDFEQKSEFKALLLTTGRFHRRVKELMTEENSVA